MTTRAFSSFLAGILLATLWVGCKENPPASLYDPNYTIGPAPQVASIAPAGGGLAGISTITITGQNFSAVPEENFVFFNQTFVPVLQASVSQLQVRAPNIVGDSIRILIGRYKEDLYSDPVRYKLTLGADDKFAAFGKADVPGAVECDAAGNLYFTWLSVGTGQGIDMVTPAGVRSHYADVFSSSVANWLGMKFGWGGAMYCVSGRNIVFQVPAGGGKPVLWLSGSGLTQLADLDFDASGNLWASGPAGNFFRITKDKVVTPFTFTGAVRAVRVFNGAVYLGGKRDSVDAVWKYPIQADGSVGAEEVYIDFTSKYGAGTYPVSSVTFSADGDMYVGTDAAAGVLLVHPDKSSEPLYAGVLGGPTSQLSWGSGPYLFQGRNLSGAGAVVKINTQKTGGAPYYGRTLP